MADPGPTRGLCLGFAVGTLARRRDSGVDLCTASEGRCCVGLAFRRAGFRFLSWALCTASEGRCVRRFALGILKFSSEVSLFV